MQKITIISGTGRVNSNTLKIAQEYYQLLSHSNHHIQLLSLENVDVCHKDEAFTSIENQYLIPAEKFIIIMPEYNGSYPGILKMLIDQSNVAACWRNKKVLLTGVSTGRAGNLRGMEHLTGSLMHMKMHVHPNRLPISAVDTLLNANGQLQNESTLNAIKEQLQAFLEF